MNLADLSEEQKNAILNEVLKMVEPESNNPDSQADEHMIDMKLEPIKQAILFLCDKVEAIEGIVNDIIGTAQEVVSTRARTSGIDRLKSTYGEKFSPYEEIYKKIQGGDMWDDMYNGLDSLTERPEDFDEEGFLSGQLQKIKDIMESVAPKVEEPVAVEVSTIEPEPEKKGSELLRAAKARGNI